MQPIQQIPERVCKNICGIFCDLDDTLTSEGKLLDVAYSALWKAHRNNLRVVIVTGRPAGWADHLARMWPVDAVVGENGAFYFWMENNKKHSYFIQDENVRHRGREKLSLLAKQILQEIPNAAVSADQTYRESDLAIDICEDIPPLGELEISKIMQIFRDQGANVKLSSIHVNGWFGSFDKFSTCCHLLENLWQEKATTGLEKYLYCGDSPNDEPMFAAFANAVGVANVIPWLSHMKVQPAYVTSLPGGKGFAEMLECILQKQN